MERPLLDGALGEEVVQGPQCCLYFRSPRLREAGADTSDKKAMLLEGMFKRKAKIRRPFWSASQAWRMERQQWHRTKKLAPDGWMSMYMVAQPSPAVPATSTTPSPAHCDKGS